ncbi:hypothetical protein [Bacillus solitudinis]|uniref:hypothetical protein n=1 Tax=Bacillus solitudinis TaxID=2014074 RepID=UPI000C2425CB|nr:hypothetical protein [Bacillus solitudinis]
MTEFQKHLCNWCDKNGMPLEKKVMKKEKSNKKEFLSKQDLEELMGLRRPTYGRRRGSLRQK